MITMIVAIDIMLLLIIAWMVIHFGRNPRNGGSPPSDSSVMNIMIFAVTFFLFVIITWLMNDKLNGLIMVTTVVVSSE
jgi:uncharacterized RDD family membrane protein YckC